MLRHFFDELVHMPRLLRAGLMVFAASGAIDLVYHSAPINVQESLSPYLGHEAHAVHVMIFIGMLLILIGVFATRPVRTHPDETGRR